MLKELQSLLVDVRACEKKAGVILASGATGTKIGATVFKLRGIACDLDDRLKQLTRTAPEEKTKLATAAPRKPMVGGRSPK